MTLHDLYLLSPYLATAGVGILVILLDLMVRQKGLLVAAALAGVLVAAALVLVQTLDTGGSLGRTGLANLVPQASVLAGSLSVDRYALFFGFLVLAALGLVVLASVDYLRRMPGHQGEYLGLLMFSATGMMLLAAATELITIYIALELTTLPLAALASFLLTGRSTEAGMKYLVIGAISSAVMLYGMALIFGFSGTTDLAGIAASFQAPAQQEVPFGSYAMLAGVALMLVGFGFKIAAVPFQMWVPDVYEGAPAPVAAFLSVASKAAGFAVLLRVFYTGFLDYDVDWGALMAVLAAASMTLGNLAAMGQSNIRRLLGYSTIAHAGYILVGVAAVSGVAYSPGASPAFTTFGPSSVLFYLAAYLAANLTAFIAIIAISNRIESDRIADYAGLFRRSPFLAVALALALVALIGVPPTSVFIAKLYVFTAAVKSGLAWLAVVGVINSVVSAYYYLRVVVVMYMKEPAGDDTWAAIAPSSSLALAVSLAVVLGLGVFPGPALSLARRAAQSLL